MTCSNVVPFRKRAPSKNELEVYHWMTRGWSPGLRRLMCPQYYLCAEQLSPRHRIPLAVYSGGTAS